MRLGIAGSQSSRLLRLAERAGQVSLLKECAGQIHVRQRKFGMQLQSSPELRDRQIKFSFGEQDPTE